MKQFIVFIHSKFSKASAQCEAIINTLPSELNINFLSIDNAKTRKIILKDSQLEIKIVPTILVVDVKGKVSKFEGKTCFEYLSQFKPPTPPPSFTNISSLTSSQEEKNTAPIPSQQQQQQIKKQAVNKKPILPVLEEPNFDEEHFNSQPTDNITSLNDDDDEGNQDEGNFNPTPLPPPIQKQPQQQKNVKPNILAHAQAMQKSRLQDDEFNKKNH